jgi:hypothetical protein
MRNEVRRAATRAACAAVLAALVVAAPVAAGEGPGDHRPRLRFGGAVSVAAPTGEFADHVDVAGGLSGVALFGRPRGVLALRADAGWLLYGSQKLRRRVPGTDGRVLEDVATTDNWIAHAELGPQLMARSGRVRPYAHAFAGVSHFATSSELVRPRRTGAFGDPFRTTTHESDTVGSYGAGTGVLIGLGGGGTALDLGVRYVANGRARYLADGDPLDGPLRRSEGHLVEFRLGIAALR